jgi:hypothetical protein
MDRSFFEWWAGLSPWLRGGVAVAVLFLSTLYWFLSTSLAAPRWAVVGWVVGGVLLLASFPNDAEKKGYHDF